jgi:CHAT domain-containing protein
MTRAALVAQTTHPARLLGVGNPMPNPNPLAFAHAELEEIAAFFGEEARTTLYEEAATEAELTKHLPGATHIHLACHGMFDPDEPLNSYLQLADQPLTLRQILDIGAFREARLVVLSACQTGITEFRRLPDEAIGLPAGFLQAGAMGVVGTLWPVDDLSTTLLMTKFYEFLLCDDEPPARALRNAQRWLREITAGELLDYFEGHRVSEEAKLAPRMPLAVAAGGVTRFALEDPASRPYANKPYHWAPFVFIGS